MSIAAVSLAASVRGVEKSFGSGESAVRALRGVDLDVPYGEITMLVGPSGCGKTTLISVIAGTLEADKGEVTVIGERLDRLSQSKKTDFRKRNIGFVFQQFNLLPTLTAVENVAIPLILNGVPRRAALERARAMLEKVELGNRTEARPAQLSGGQQQRVAIARALVHEPKLLVCDEPTAALDGETGHLVMELLRERALAADRGVLIVTHDNRIFEYGDRFARMLDGHLVGVEEVSKEAST